MHDPDSRRAEELFQRAADLPATEHNAFLDRECAGNPGLRDRVARLLIFLDTEDSKALDKPVISFPASERTLLGGVPERIGRYRLVRLVGEGGMGAVYEAEQDSPQRTVALKIIRPGLASRAILQRFQQESQVLGKLNHPGIAQVYEAGVVNDQGDLVHADHPHRLTRCRPFFAMEFIHGVPLDTFAAEHMLSTHDRLALIALVCDAVEHAHQHGIVHRDLKPGNILVASSLVAKHATPNPKILDFGVARVMDADFQTETLRTGVGELIGTLAYMSPEQASGDGAWVDARSDIYALGVLAYQLLTGRLPLDLSRREIPEAARMIREDEPSKLGSVNVSFRGDIETIVSKALEKDKSRRYGSAAAFAADIRRFLQDEPIIARPSSSLYQLRKFAKRNRPLVGGILATMMALVIGTGVSLRLATLRSRQTAIARQTAARAERQAYRACIAAAHAAIQGHNTALAGDSLRDAPAALRGWEWNYLDHVRDRSLVTIPAIEPNPVRLIAASPDGELLYTIGRGGDIRVTDARTGRDAGSFTVTSASIDRFALSPDGARLLVSDPNSLSLWNLADRSRLWSRPGYFLISLDCFVHDGAFFATSESGSLSVEIVDTATSRTIATVPTSVPAFDYFAFSQRGTELLLVNRQGIAELHDFRIGPPVNATKRWEASISTAKLCFDDTGVVGYHKWHELSLIDVASGKEQRRIPGDAIASLKTVVGELFVTIEPAPQMIVRDPDSLNVLARLDGFKTPVHARPIIIQGPKIVGGSETGEIKVFDAFQRDLPFVVQQGNDITFASAISSDSERVACVGWGSAAVWDVQSGELVWSRYLSPRDIYCVAYSPSGDELALWLIDRGLVILDALDGREIAACRQSEPFEPTSLLWSTDDRIFVSAPEGGLSVFSAAAVLLGKSPDVPPTFRVTASCATDQGNVRAFGSDDGTVNIINAAGNQARVSSRPYTRIVSRLVFSPDMKLLAARYDDGVIVILDPRTAREVARVDAHAGRPRPAAQHINQDPHAAIAFSPDGLRLAAVAADRTIRFWDCASWELILSLDCPEQSVVALSFSPDSSRMVGSSYRHPIICYETSEPACGLKAREVIRVAQAQAKKHLDTLSLASLAGDAIRADQSIPPVVREAAISFIRACDDHPHYLNSGAWGTVMYPNREPGDYQRALRLALRACEIAPRSPPLLNTLGIAQYRVQRYQDCVASLEESERIFRESGQPSDFTNVLFIAMAQRQLGHHAEAAAMFSKAKTLYDDKSVENIGFMHEAKRLIDDLTHPAELQAPSADR